MQVGSNSPSIRWTRANTPQLPPLNPRAMELHGPVPSSLSPQNLQGLITELNLSEATALLAYLQEHRSGDTLHKISHQSHDTRRTLFVSAQGPCYIKVSTDQKRRSHDLESADKELVNLVRVDFESGTLCPFALLTMHPSSLGKLHLFLDEDQVGRDLNHPRATCNEAVAAWDVAHPQTDEPAQVLGFFQPLAPHGDLLHYALSGALTPTRYLKFMQQIAEILHWIHQDNKLYRDPKPQNILIFEGPEGPYAALCDYTSVCQADSPRTRTPAGTPGYMRRIAQARDLESESSDVSDDTFLRGRTLDVPDGSEEASADEGAFADLPEWVDPLEDDSPAPRTSDPSSDGEPDVFATWTGPVLHIEDDSPEPSESTSLPTGDGHWESSLRKSFEDRPASPADDALGFGVTMEKILNMMTRSHRCAAPVPATLETKIRDLIGRLKDTDDSPSMSDVGQELRRLQIGLAE